MTRTFVHQRYELSTQQSARPGGMAPAPVATCAIQWRPREVAHAPTSASTRTFVHQRHELSKRQSACSGGVAPALGAIWAHLGAPCRGALGRQLTRPYATGAWPPHQCMATVAAHYSAARIKASATHTHLLGAMQRTEAFPGHGAVLPLGASSSSHASGLGPTAQMHGAHQPPRSTRRPCSSTLLRWRANS